MGGVADRWAARDEQPTHLPPHPSLHQETTGSLRVKIHVGLYGFYMQLVLVYVSTTIYICKGLYLQRLFLFSMWHICQKLLIQCAGSWIMCRIILAGWLDNNQNLDALTVCLVTERTEVRVQG